MTDSVKIALISAMVAIITTFGSLYLKKGEVTDATEQLKGAATTAKKLNENISATSLPPGMVASFNLASCPAGWSEFEKASGRSLVGVGAGAGLTARNLLEMGGSETHVLSVNELPPHQHATSEAGDAGNSRHGIELGHGKHGVSWADTTVSLTGKTGGGQPLAVMPPYVAVRFCTKL